MHARFNSRHDKSSSEFKLTVVYFSNSADVDAADADGYTALHCATEAGHAEVVDLLLKNDANAKAMTVKGRTAPEAAATVGKSKVVRLLEKAGGMARKDVSEKVSSAVAKTGSMDRRRRARKGRHMVWWRQGRIRSRRRSYCWVVTLKSLFDFGLNLCD